jgi:hypothetical protein
MRGCWLEGSRGWRIAGDVVRLAWDYGMPHDSDDELIIGSFMDSVSVVLSDGTKVSNGINDTQDAADFVLGQAGMADNAEAWLTDNVAPRGFAFGFFDGEFFLYCTESEFDSDDEICSACGDPAYFHDGEF